jgi:hypothetical protein
MSISCRCSLWKSVECLGYLFYSESGKDGSEECHSQCFLRYEYISDKVHAPDPIHLPWGNNEKSWDMAAGVICAQRIRISASFSIARRREVREYGVLGMTFPFVSRLLGHSQDHGIMPPAKVK